MEHYDLLEKYTRLPEPDKAERARNWSVALGLQDVDQLKPSDYLINQVTHNIEGSISREQLSLRLAEYYQQVDIRSNAINNGSFEADNVAVRINDLLAENAFTLSQCELTRIHKYLFADIIPSAGLFRSYNISKNQWVLNGDSVTYGSADLIPNLLRFDFDEERKYNYSNHSVADALAHIARFISGIWQIHPFAEGNTRTIAVFLIKHLRSFGFNVNNDSFALHSWFFRNALVRSQYENILAGVHRTFEPLERFLNFAVFDIPADLRNRTLHIAYSPEQDTPVPTAPDLASPDALKHLLNRFSLNEVAVIDCIAKNPHYSIASIAASTRLARSTVNRIVKKLIALGYLSRLGSRNLPSWSLILPHDY